MWMDRVVQVLQTLELINVIKKNGIRHCQRIGLIKGVQLCTNDDDDNNDGDNDYHYFRNVNI